MIGKHLIRLLCLCTCLVAGPVQAQSDTPWRLAQALKLSDTFTLSGTHRSRYEALANQFRAGGSGNDQIFALRTTLKAQLRLDRVEFVVEVMDSRQGLSDDGTPVSTSIINAFELIQGYVAFHLADVKDGKLQLQLGRHTMDIGDRRLVARNLYRNTVNNFTGINGKWQSDNGHIVRIFYVLPIDRLPSDRPSLIDNDFKFDEEDFDRQFWGINVERANLFSNVRGQVYLFGLHEDDNATRNTRNRNFYTTGFYLVRKPARNQIDFDFQSVFQIGKSRASTSAADVTDLDHMAHFQHFILGYTLDIPSALRMIFQFDYVSGDRNPVDGNNNQFDSLFGVPRPDFGPTGIYRTFTRSNIISPGYRLFANPITGINVMFAHHLYWLASSKDAWTAARVVDPTGNSGSYVGNQPEIRIRWEALPGNLRIEAGMSYLFTGGFMKNAPNATGEGNPAYGYLQTIFTF